MSAWAGLSTLGAAVGEAIRSRAGDTEPTQPSAGGRGCGRGGQGGLLTVVSFLPPPSGSSKIEEACEIYARAANMFKMAKNWSGTSARTLPPSCRTASCIGSPLARLAPEALAKGRKESRPEVTGCPSGASVLGSSARTSGSCPSRQSQASSRGCPYGALPSSSACSAASAPALSLSCVPETGTCLGHSPGGWEGTITQGQREKSWQAGSTLQLPVLVRPDPGPGRELPV